MGAVEVFQPQGAAVAASGAASAAATAALAKIKGRQKAAVLLVSIGTERAAQVFSRLKDDEIESLSLEMAKLQFLEPGLADGVLAEMAATVQAYDSLNAGGVDYAREVLERALGPERANEIIGRLSSVIEKRPFEFLRKTPPEQVVTFLRNESPQTTALVIANLHTTLAAQVLSNLPENEQPEIALRIARMSETSPDVVKQVEAVMKAKLANVVQQEYSAAGGIKSLADILNNADRSTERNVLDKITETDESLGAEVRRLLFVFEDITKLDDRSIQLILREADQKDLALALRGVADDVKDGSWPTCPSAARRCSSRRCSSSRRSASATSRRPRDASWPSCASSRRPAPSSCRDRTKTLSSETAAATIAAYTFRQLEAPAGSVRDVADVLSAAHADADQIRQHARAAGEAEGRAAGLAAARAEMEPSLHAVAGAAQALDASRDQVIAELEHDAVALALRLAEQIVAATIEVEPERIVDIAAVALRRIRDRQHVTLVVNPADLELMSDAVTRLQSELGGIEHLNVQSDRRVGRGGVLARTDEGEIDASLETQLARAREVVAAELGPRDGVPENEV